MAELTQALAIFALNTRNFVVAARLYERLAAQGRSRGEPKTEAIAYHQLGMVAEEQRDFAAAEQWCRKVARHQGETGR